MRAIQPWERLRDVDAAGIPWSPFPGPQQRAFGSAADEVYYGGAAGGGKTDLLLGLAATAHRRSIIFRREYPQLREIIERSRELLEEHGGFNAQTNLWRLADGRLLEFGAVQQEGSARRYQGRAHDLKAFDELPHFTEAQYRFLIAWNRSPTPGQRCRVVAAGNPPTDPEGEWVLRYWGAWLDPEHSNPAEPGELRWYAAIEGKDREVESGVPFEHRGETIQPRSRTFIPARLEDNPILRDTGYRAVLQGLPEPLRSQMLFGDYSAGAEDDPWQVIPTAWIRAAQARWTPEPPAGVPLTALGVDVARGGADKTALCPRHATWYGTVAAYPGKSTPDGQSVAALAVAALGDRKEAAVNIDSIGVGSAPVDILRENAVRVVPVNFAVASKRRDRTDTYALRNLRTEGYWLLREALDPESGEGVALPPDRELLAELCAHRWKLSMGGIMVESKDEVKARLGRSPDKADAVVLAGLQLGGWATDAGLRQWAEELAAVT